MNDNRTAGTTTGRQHATYHHATSPQATQHREVTPRTAIHRARPALLLASLICQVCGLMLFSACANYDDLEFVPVSDVVKHTQLALSASGSNTATRMSSAVTQADEQANGSHFRGISDLFLLPFQISNNDRDYIKQNFSPSGSQVVAGNNTIPSIYNGANSKYYLDVAIPVGTNAFLVYGRATGSNSSLTERQTNGVLAHEGLTSTVGTTPAGITFSPIQMVSQVTTNHAAGTKGDDIITYLNSIFNQNWADATGYPVLYNFYDMVTAMQAGSSASVIAFVQEIYDALKNSSSANGVSTVISAIENSNYVTVSDGKLSFKEDYQGYPTTDLGLPDGAAVILWNETSHSFEAVTSKNNFNGLNADVTNFVFPAELYYRANSRIHTSEVELTDVNTQAPAIFNRAAWGNLESDNNTSVLKQQLSGNNLFTPNGMVYNTTTIVAITDPLQYAVSRLDLKLTASGETLEDNADTPNPIPVSSLKITGVLVGQQSPVDYLFHSKWANEGDQLYTIYDSKIDEDASAFNASKFTHTLVMETVKDQEVNIAVEIQNNSDFDIVTGTDKHIVPPGCKFYLIGQLNPQEKNADNTYKFGYDPDVPEKNRVFCQDHMTSVTFTVNDLRNAYYVIPPLSSTQLEFSLAVASWKISTSVGKELEYNED